MILNEKADLIINDIKLECEDTKCEYSSLNKQCIDEKCLHFDIKNNMSNSSKIKKSRLFAFIILVAVR